MEGHGILAGHKCTNPGISFQLQFYYSKNSLDTLVALWLLCRMNALFPNHF